MASASLACVCVCVYVLHIIIKRSGLNHNQQQYTTWLPMRYVVCEVEKDQRNIYIAPTRALKKNEKNKYDKNKGTIIRQSTWHCQKKIEEGHSIERVWYSTSRE